MRETGSYFEYTLEAPQHDLIFTAYVLETLNEGILIALNIAKMFDGIKQMLLGIDAFEIFAMMLEEWPLTSRVFLNSLREIPLIGDAIVCEGQDPDNLMPSWFIGQYLGNLPVMEGNQAQSALFGLFDDFLSIGLALQSEWTTRSPAQVILAAQRLPRTFLRKETKLSRSLLSDKDRKRINQIGVRTIMSRAGIRMP